MRFIVFKIESKLGNSFVLQGQDYFKLFINKLPQTFQRHLPERIENRLLLKNFQGCFLFCLRIWTEG